MSQQIEKQISELNGKLLYVDERIIQCTDELSEMRPMRLQIINDIRVLNEQLRTETGENAQSSTLPPNAEANPELV